MGRPAADLQRVRDADLEQFGRDREQSGAEAGGGIASGFGATTTLNNSEVSWNTVPGTAGGGGIVSLASALTLKSSTVDDNTGPGGGGIASGNGRVAGRQLDHAEQERDQQQHRHRR